MKQTVLPARLWYQTDNGKWASREKTAEDHKADRELKARLGIEDGVTGAFGGFSVAAQRAADAVRGLNEILREKAGEA